jgi:phosphoribosylanthranilate isomerase
MKIKLCGFTEKNSLQVAIEQKCDFIGFVFCEKSPRNITPQSASELGALIPAEIAKVAVTVDASFEFLTEISQKLHPNFFQFHGAEDEKYIAIAHQKFPDIKIIKAFRIASAQDLEAVHNFENHVDFFLFDAPSAGSGKKFDWEILRNFTSKKDWFLSGGLNTDNIAEALQITSAPMVDISSGIEEIRGKKSAKLITEFTQKTRNLC